MVLQPTRNRFLRSVGRQVAEHRRRRLDSLSPVWRSGGGSQLKNERSSSRQYRLPDGKNSFVLLMAASKGGAGKSLIGIHLATLAAQSGFRCLIIDTDLEGDQQSCVEWSKLRSITGPTVIPAKLSQGPHAICWARRQGSEFMVVDTTGRDLAAKAPGRHQIVSAHDSGPPSGPGAGVLERLLGAWLGTLRILLPLRDRAEPTGSGRRVGSQNVATSAVLGIGQPDRAARSVLVHPLDPQLFAAAAPGFEGKLGSEGQERVLGIDQFGGVQGFLVFVDTPSTLVDGPWRRPTGPWCEHRVAATP